ncbi:MAG TPA: SMC-Scp complex subunit ScpB [Marinospirillum sp.]|uniref:SMC-Scp complex subunit ScpB n=1 Tax=Marinospirillum sp. TaxID=2183934 RepID=UPI002B4967F3|nr:SMC-Scp complex subunit ScpB [Marinospirillum sp.]HKM16485.1 SMC-Scp complex subunit ScpB [Marinospirillum sp.]
MNEFSLPQLTRIVQALLLAAKTPLTLEQLAAIFDEYQRPYPYKLREVLAILQQEAADSSQELIEVAGGFRYQIKADYAPWVSRLWDEKPPRYSRALLETLSLIAYRQPVTRSEIEDVRGVSVGSQIIRTLEEREWIRVIGHREAPGRPALYATTRHFLDYFNLKSLNELPTLAALRALAENEQQEWQDDLDQTLHSPLLDLEDDKVANETDNQVDESVSFGDLLDKNLPDVKELTFADLAARFKTDGD